MKVVVAGGLWEADRSQMSDALGPRRGEGRPPRFAPRGLCEILRLRKVHRREVRGRPTVP